MGSAGTGVLPTGRGLWPSKWKRNLMGQAQSVSVHRLCAPATCCWGPRDPSTPHALDVDIWGQSSGAWLSQEDGRVGTSWHRASTLSVNVDITPSPPPHQEGSVLASAMAG